MNKFKNIFKKKEYGMLLVLIGMVIICTIISPVFRSFDNILNLFQQNSVIGIMSIGMVIILLTGAIDLSVGSVLALTGIVSSLMFKSMGFVAGVAGGLAAGALIGFVNGILITKVKINNFITTLGTMTFVRGIVYISNGGFPVRGIPTEYNFMGMGRIGGIIPISAVIWFVLVIAMYFVLKYTKFGQYLYAIGGNETATWLSGVNVNRTKVIAFTLCGLFAAAGALIYVSRVLIATADAGNGYELQVIAACIVGGISMDGGRGNIFGSVVGVFILGIIMNILQLTGTPSTYQSAITGLIILVTVGFDSVTSRKRD